MSISLPSKENSKGAAMTNRISAEFHAEIIVELFNDYRDLRKVKERARILLSGASAEHLQEVGRSLPEHLVHVVPRGTPRAAWSLAQQ
jgi:hypothetical protein